VTSRILIIDYGSQFTQLIARRVREARVYSEIHPPTRTVDWIREWAPTGIILSGGPSSVYDEGAPLADPDLLDVAPVLAICYGMHVVAKVEGALNRVQTKRILNADDPLARGLEGKDTIFYCLSPENWAEQEADLCLDGQSCKKCGNRLEYRVRISPSSFRKDTFSA
jgi:hypothetical protein